ncbi:hypothetical protein LEP1GSC062_0154 [Leptospira alexanderi serovar Manhao 3 str. L 60]|uniref:Uncharacterized protein n=1 Tax=Leptospira alexanderi serovar Manhao 3 str. L 60 TaxID=1049759 RepID=V6I5E7_9LEPT|nr:hypothetical protein LEP1GSC062_0154 [Leptospira alexanderi serovar Manhao 3 str. L 60]
MVRMKTRLTNDYKQISRGGNSAPHSPAAGIEAWSINWD